ncbi:unnamed protein product, partial [Mesorhabditis spiculigera]
MRFFLLTIFVLVLLAEVLQASPHFKLRRGGHLERVHRQALSDWKRAHHRSRRHRHRHKRRRHGRDEAQRRIDHITDEIDGYVRPRFGRSVA